ncbi:MULTISPECIES: hypothetical protein [Variovorax]|uniref:hypothetical protein n=1 Tax=Variovorax TaxID=34072 RepID=UPI0028587154|nr:hypothetical protein [Variovorax sp. 3319]MDR6886112.1 hypothetical protein [Variovorax sp. 3319]
MNADTKMMRTLAAIGQCTTYSEMASVTGIDAKLLMTNVAHLKRRGYVERINEGAPKCEIAYFRRTAAGDELIQGEPEPEIEPFPVVVMTSVQRAIQRRHALATVWSAA